MPDSFKTGISRDGRTALVCDLSFISLTHILPAFPPLIKPGGFAVLLIKPQFELEQRKVLKGSIWR